MTAPAPLRTPTATLALLLHLADSSFPSGAFTASWGLEGLVATGDVADEAGVERFVVDQVQHRWAPFDRVVAHLVAEALRGDDPLAGVLELDAVVEAMSLPPAQREASRAAGRTLLTSAGALLGGHIEALRQALDAAGSPQHLAVAHPLVFLSAGAALGEAEVVGGMQLVQQLASAALRLGVIGHVAGQRVIAAGRRELVTILAAPPAELRPAQFVPLAEIAMYRHQTLPARMFRC
ncbi:MAG: urease accessory protein UreF [Acidimicrobiia bacterium]